MPLTRLPLTTGVSGTLPVGSGGTGVTTSADLANTGNMVLLSQASSTTAVGSIDFTTSSLYDDYMLSMTLIPVTDNTHITFRVLVGGNPQTGSGDYAYGTIRTDGGSHALAAGSNGDNRMYMHTSYGAGNVSDEGLSFNMHMININSTNKPKDFFWNIVVDNTSNAHLGFIGNGRYNSNANVISGIRFAQSSGNISKYDYRFYGLRK